MKYGAPFARQYRGLFRWLTPLNEPRVNAWYAGRVGQFDHPRVQEAIQIIADAARRAGKHWGMPMPTLERARQLMALGARGYVTKPFLPETLRAELERTLGVPIA